MARALMIIHANDPKELNILHPGLGKPVEEYTGTDRPTGAPDAELYFTSASPGCWWVNNGGTWYKIC